MIYYICTKPILPIMRNYLPFLCAVLLGLVVCAAAQDLSPTLFGAKPPLLLLFGCLAGIPTAIGAGLFTDALGDLPFGCSALFFLAVALFVRFVRPAALVGVMLAAGLYQLWIALWGGTAPSLRPLLGALTVAVVLAPFLQALLRLARRRIGIDVKGDTSR